MRIIILVCLLSICCHGMAQEHYADSLKQKFNVSKEDSSKLELSGLLSSYYSELFPDSALIYADKMIELAVSHNYKYLEALGLLYKIAAITKKGDFTSAIHYAYEGLNVSKGLNEHREYILSRYYQVIGEIYSLYANPRQSLNYFYNSIELRKKSGEHLNDFYKIYFSLAFAILQLEKKDSALFYLNKGWDLFSDSKEKKSVEPWIVSGNVYRNLGNLEKAEEYFRKGMQTSKEKNSLFFVAAISSDLAGLFYDKGLRDSCIKYLHQSLSLSQENHYRVFEMASSGFLSFLYDSVSTDSTLKYLKIYNGARDEVYSEEKIRQFQAAGFEEERRMRDLEDTKKEYMNRLKLYVLIGAAAFFLIISFILFRNNRHKQRVNKLLAQQKGKVEATLSELKAAQSQLIQSEKMASMGELTAGIAHEIQNPLNFVNNFSDLNKELLAEMNEEIEKKNFDEVMLIAKDITENEEKINHHGKRADAIVKSMLQHSRSSSGVKELTDINALCDEYLRLAYHGLRAKDKNFNAKFETNPDPNLPKLNVVPQEIGRVILNLINNAFYAVTERKKLNQEGYEPLVTVTTKLFIPPLGGQRGAEISVKDNGTGIPQKVLDKIFQPFFTTKPTGQGTGLGLSLSYDIVIAHGGEIKVETRDGEGSEFIIQLPLS